ncbi:MAG: dimethylamine corrinoid protein [Clostridia bacterium]|nr:dimethylamine corrinoid protein [Clostridia bacterium]
MRILKRFLLGNKNFTREERKMERVKKLTQALSAGDQAECVTLAKELLAEGADLDAVIKEMTNEMREVGKRFETFEIFLPEMMMAAEAMMAVMDVFGPHLVEGSGVASRGTVLIGAPRGDMHEIGKNIVKLMLKANGFQIIDLGPNVDPLEFIKRAEEAKADVIAISTLMTTTMPGATQVIQLLNDKGIRDKYKVIVGGAPTNPDWAKQIGADGWAEDASKATELVEKLLGVN